MKLKKKKCHLCGGDVLKKSNTNHVLHLLYTVISCGLLSPFWLYAYLNNKGYYCSRCGAKFDSK